MSELQLPAYPPSAEPIQLGTFIFGPKYVQRGDNAFRIGGTTWRLNEASAMSQRTSTLIVVLAIIVALFTCFLGLLLLLIKETYVMGYVTVEVTHGSVTLSEMVPVHSRESLQWVRGAVHQAQMWSLADLNRTS